MAFYKYGKKNYGKKRYYRKTLKKSNIFSKKSAKSQAKQIYALNKKINRIEYKTKPEIICKDCYMWSSVDKGYSESAPQSEFHTYSYLYEENLFNASKINYQMKGNMLRPYNITLYGSFQNCLYEYNLDGTPLKVPLTGYLRIIVCKLDGGNQGRYPVQITKNFSSETDYGLINGPLVSDITASLKIVKDKVIKIDEEHPCKLWRIKIKSPGTYRTGEYYGNPPAFKNEYLVYYQLYTPLQLRVEYSGVPRWPGPVQVFTSSVKFAFTDEN